MRKPSKTQLSVEVSAKLRQCALVELAAIEHQEAVQQNLAAALKPLLADHEQPPDLRPVHDALSRWLAYQRERLVQADADYGREVRWGIRLRQRRDELMSTVIDRLRWMQAQMTNAYGAAQSAALAGFATGLQVTNAEHLARIARDAVNELRRSNLKHVKSREGVTLDHETIARSIEEPLFELETVLAEELPSIRKTQGALGAKVAQIETLTRELKRVSVYLQGSYRLVGMDFQADRLRPKRSAAPEKTEEPPPAAEAETVGEAANDTAPAEAAV